ncbi:LAFE_0F14400g1_1 [Lachancea fermentati]|uniref:LAFE_0F14400g1_1 n=1 Tax=Lachancea fermentati TaxID=4955 RepID=A0A1G4MG68_LACFM|nr:LAFE_0F14400g1_1 [Lachancea fermentati]
MATIAQLLSIYYESVIECERLYYRHLEAQKGHANNDSSESLLAKETINLQRQVAQLTADLNIQKRETERIKELHKTQRALFESKLENAKKTISKLKRSGAEIEDDKDACAENQQAKFHLLSPINRQTSFGNGNDAVAGTPSGKQHRGLRHAITNGNPTLFDEDTTDLADKTEEAAFIESLKSRDKLAEIVLPTSRLSSSGDDIQSDKAVTQKPQKKRRLIRKRIERTEMDMESQV